MQDGNQPTGYPLASTGCAATGDRFEQAVFETCTAWRNAAETSTTSGR